MDKEDVVYIYMMEYYSAIKRKEIGSFVEMWMDLKKLKIGLPYDPAISLLGIYPEKTILQKDTCTPMFIAALFTIAKTW